MELHITRKSYLNPIKQGLKPIFLGRCNPTLIFKKRMNQQELSKIFEEEIKPFVYDLIHKKTIGGRQV